MLVGCGGPTIDTDRDSTIPIPQSPTYAWAGQQDVQGQTDPTVNNSIIHQRIRTAVDAQMQQKGYKETSTPESADFFIRYYLGLKKSTSYVTTTTGTTVGGYYGGWAGWGYGWGYAPVGVGATYTTTTPVENREAGFLMQLVEVKSGKVAWQGLFRNDAPAKSPTQDRINEGAEELLKTLPRAGTPAGAAKSEKDE
jgi:hypothetical protein